MHSDLVVSERSERPLYLQITDQVKRLVAVGDWEPGRELPSIRSLAAALGVSVITVKRAYADLEAEGVVVSRQGRGTFVGPEGFRPESGDLEVRIAESVAEAVGLARTLGWRRRELDRLVAQRWEESEPEPSAPGRTEDRG